ncbi:hypothetical protein F4810DRAFT_136844 [Camillea tinctor]|nr:hypothetical protein F4810DRAFT_136844 [Camillea tinctor]
MMSSVVGTNMSQITPQSYMSDPTLDELSTQLALADSLRRLSRASNGQRTSGNAMRIVKPSSASSSPQAMMARRRTLINDSNLAARRRQQAWDQVAYQQMQDVSCYSNHQEPVKRSSRPVSWHPGSQFQQPQMHMPMPQPDFSQYIMPTQVPYQQDVYAGYPNFPPTPAAYSGHTSPTATFSPLSLPFTAPQPQTVPQYVTADTWHSTTNFEPDSYVMNGSPGGTEPFPAYTAQESFNWNPIPAQGYNCTAPPTPEEFQPIQQSQLEMAPEESIPYQPLEEPEEEEEEEEGEILIGMGLYDPPSKGDTDPELDNYRTTTSQLLDTTYRRGKGWKLEEAWEPPAAEEDEDEEDDADGETQEEKDESPESTPAEQSWV